MIEAKVVADSIAVDGTRLLTLEVELHRFILPEFNSHRAISRNFQSSRAVPVATMIEQVRSNPALPVHFGKNQSGMVAEETNASKVLYYPHHFQNQGRDPIEVEVSKYWRMVATEASERARELADAGYHKQIVNRLLEPFMWTKGVVTATKEAWDAFFLLRCHKDAQPEIKALADKIKEAIAASTPEAMQVGDWHLPYVTQEARKELGLELAIKVSASCAAQVSYRRLDESACKATKIYDMLNLPSEGNYPSEPPHFSPTEHIAMCVNKSAIKRAGFSESDVGGNFQTHSFYQYRKMLEVGTELEFISISK